MTVPALTPAQAHAVALSRPMVGVPMMGEPVIQDSKHFDPLFVRRACQYALTILQRDPEWIGDLSHLVSVYAPPDRVMFCTKLGEHPIVVATVVLPKRVMDFNPSALPVVFRERAWE